MEGETTRDKKQDEQREVERLHKEKVAKLDSKIKNLDMHDVVTISELVDVLRIPTGYLYFFYSLEGYNQTTGGYGKRAICHTYHMEEKKPQ